MAALAQPITSLSLDNLECHLTRLRSAIQQAQRELHGLQHAVAEATTLSSDRSAVESLNGQPRALSRQELRVARLVAQGRSNLEIAATLHVSVHTIKSQVRSILRKGGLRSRWQLVSEPSSQQGQFVGGVRASVRGGS